MKKILPYIFLILLSFTSFAQAPANDNCSTATNLGTLPTPAPCPSGVGTSVNSVGTNINATSPAIYTTLLGCQTGGNQPGPALDVWYTFVATGNMIIVNITPGAVPVLANPAVTLWTGSCGSLVGMNCANNGSAGGVLTVTFQPTTPGVTYYMQVSGSTPTAAGNFNLSIHNNNDCNNCNTSSILTYTPAPVGGTYPPGTTVNFCYKINTFNQVSVNWLHGVIPTFGCGWDLTTLVPTPAPSCAGTGTWNWKNSCTSSANLTTTGPGFYYETNLGSTCACVNTNPGDNFGDAGALNCTWTFCWSIKTKPTCACPNLNISINTTGDGESGSWSSIACTGDPDYTFGASMNCCSVTAVSTSVTCFGGTNGSATATPNGAAPYTYTWSSTPVQNTQTATNLPAGTYTVTVKDNVGCISTTTVLIAQPSVITVPITFVPATCSALNGSATANPTGGVGPYTYTWSTVPVQNTQSATGLGAGIYTCSVTDAHGCIKTGTVNVTSVGALTASATFTNVTCFGAANGSATALPVGTAPYTYTWSTAPVQNTQVATGLVPGTYTCSIKDASGCTTTTTVTITQPALLTAVISASTNVTCFGGNNGTANITVAGGTAAYSYTWNSTPVQNSQNATGLIAGNYTVTVKDSKGCLATASVVITQPPLVTVTATNTGPYCAGATIQLNSTAATTYTWTGPGGFTSNAQNPTIAGSTVGMSGTYTVMVSVGTCTASSTTVVTVNALPTPVVGNTGPYCAGTAIQLNCTAATTYSWSGPSGFTSNAQNPTLPGSTVAMGGVYTVSVTNALGCVNTASTTVVINPIPVPVIGSNSPVCIGSSINLTSSGGTSYSWSGPNAFTSALQNPVIPGSTIAMAGVYTVTVTSLGCSATNTVNVAVSSPTTSASNTGPYCAGATIQLNTNAFTTYTWTGPGAFASNAQNPVRPAATVGMSGTYTVISTVGTCTATATTNVVVNPLPLPLASSNSPVCAATPINFTGSGGTTYTWTGPSAYSSNSQNPTIASAIAANAGTYTLTVTDAAGCTNSITTVVVVNPLPVPIANNGGPYCVGTTISLTGGGGGTYSWTGPAAFASALQNPTIPAATLANGGTYTVLVTLNTCTAQATTNVVVSTATASASNTGPYCAGTTIQLNTPVATSYTWTGPAAFASNLQNPVRPLSTVAMSGTYTVIISIGTCTASATTSVTVNALPVAIPNSNSPVCVGDPITFTGAGGVTYFWGGPSGYTVAAQNPTIAAATVGNSGTYTLLVVDANTCTNVATTNVVVNTAPVIVVNNPTVCVNQTINLTANGGATYAWSGPGGFVSSLQNPILANATGAMSGQYTVMVTSAAGCTNSAISNVTVYPLPTPAITSNTPCVGSTLNLTGSGGAVYAWSGPNGFNSFSQNPNITSVSMLANGIYTLLATAGTCTASTTSIITVNPLPNPTINSNSPVCVGTPINLTGTGGVSYSWTGPSGFTDATQNPTIAVSAVSNSGTYTLTVTDANGCVNSVTKPVVVNPQPIVSASGGTVCENANANLTATGGTSYSWSGPGGFTSASQNPVVVASPSTVGQYTVIVTNANTCTNTAMASIGINPAPVASIVTNAPICINNVLNIAASGGISYSWSGPNGFFSTAQSATIQANSLSVSGNYFVTVTDAGGCTATTSMNVLINAIPNVNITSGPNMGCAPLCVSFTCQTSVGANADWIFGNGNYVNGNISAIGCYNALGFYTVTANVTDTNGCKNSGTYTVGVYPQPVADFNYDPYKPILNHDADVHFTDASYGATITEWNWYFMNNASATSNLQNPTYIYEDAGEFVIALVVKSDKGCVDTILKSIVVGDDFGIWVPNAFTVNGDGLNDLFYAKGYGIKEFEMTIFDRWGEKVFSSTDINEAWDGTYQNRGSKIVKEDSYTWIINVTTVFGKSKEFTGHVTLIK